MWFDIFRKKRFCQVWSFKLYILVKINGFVQNIECIHVNAIFYFQSMFVFSIILGSGLECPYLLNFCPFLLENFSLQSTNYK